MILFKKVGESVPWHRGCVLAAVAMALTACAGGMTDDTTNSRLIQSTQPNQRQPIEAGDIVIAGQDFAHSVRALPEVADATVPPLVQFAGVTSIVGPVPLDTEPYTSLLRDRLVVGTYQKLRFVENQLPPLVTTKKGKKSQAAPAAQSEPDFQVVAELRGKSDDNILRIQIQFIDFHTGTILYDGLYLIRKEQEAPPDAPVENTAPIVPQNAAPQGAETGAR